MANAAITNSGRAARPGPDARDGTNGGASRRIVVYGATGTAGRLIASLLQDHGTTLVLAGRDRGRLEEVAQALETGESTVEVCPAPVHDPAGLRRAMDGADIVIACAGPFARMGEPVMRAAIACGVHYLDIAIEQSFLRHTYESCESLARKAGVVVVSGLGCLVGLGDIAAHLAAQTLAEVDQPGKLDEVTVAYAFERLSSGHDHQGDDHTMTTRPGQGLRRSLIDSASQPALLWSHDRWDTTALAGEHLTCNFGDELGEQPAIAFPLGDVITLPRHLSAARIQTYIALAGLGPLGPWLARASRFFGPVVSLALRSPWAVQARPWLDEWLAGSSLAIGAAADLFVPTEPRVVVTAVVRRGFLGQRVLLTADDPYHTSAALVAWAAARLLSADHIPPGVRAPGEIFAPRAALDALAEQGHIQFATSAPG